MTLLQISVLHLFVPSRILFSLTESLRRHPKRVAASLAALLLGTGVTAFGVAPLVPDAADLPVRQVLEAVQTLPTDAQGEILGDFRFKLFRTESTRSADTHIAVRSPCCNSTNSTTIFASPGLTPGNGLGITASARLRPMATAASIAIRRSSTVTVKSI